MLNWKNTLMCISVCMWVCVWTTVSKVNESKRMKGWKAGGEGDVWVESVWTWRPDDLLIWSLYLFDLGAHVCKAHTNTRTYNMYKGKLPVQSVVWTKEFQNIRCRAFFFLSRPSSPFLFTAVYNPLRRIKKSKNIENRKKKRSDA